MRQPQVNVEKNRSLLFGTVMLLVIGFVALIILFIGFTAILPSFMGKCVAVVDVDVPLSIEGEPTTMFTEGYLGSEGFANVFTTLDRREDVGAVVIVFNSPGGSVVATREVYDSVKEMKKPKVSYFREMAASGAYYIASGTDYIISDPDALTGSIGVVATFTDMSGLLEKIGVNVTSVTSGPHKDIGSLTRPMTEEEYNITKALIDEIFAEFKSIVTQNRAGKLDSTLFAQVLDGRILSGRQAQKVGLVDQTGSKRDAIIKAADLANISYTSYEDIRICKVPTHGESAGLLSADAFFRLFTSDNGAKVSYR